MDLQCEPKHFESGANALKYYIKCIKLINKGKVHKIMLGSYMFVNYIWVLCCFVGEVLFKYFIHIYLFYKFMLPFCFVNKVFFKEQTFYILKSNLLIFYFMFCASLFHLENLCMFQSTKMFSYVFSRNSRVLDQYSFFPLMQILR